MSSDQEMRAIQNCVANSIGQALVGYHRIAGVIGENPSRYSKSPSLWNAVFARFGIEANYLPFDVSPNRLGEFISVLRNAERVLGFNVTVPHKARVIEYLDALDPRAARIKAVNLVARTTEGRLVGYNTDGAGFLESILKPQPGRSESFVESLGRLKVLLIGAGGSARAVAFHIADQLTDGELLICNRTWLAASSLAEELRHAGGPVRAIPEEELGHWATEARLIINSTTKGQGGTRALPDGKFISLEAYSALAPANAVASPRLAPDQTGSQDDTARAALADISRNHQISLMLAQSIPKNVAFYDLVYFPEETVFLRHARMTGHKTMNGKAMIICQAARGLFDYVCKPDLQARGLHTPETYNQITETMYRAW